ncbi:MAG: DUF402 domain-containing protein [Chloroflexaceae bacterium]|nr:DUF402 domain-containing protein [Chloroflexaceae bacterium]
MNTITIQIIKPAKQKVVTYTATVLQRTLDTLLVRAIWTAPLVDMGYVTFAPQDHLYEYFYTHRWYNVYDLYSATGEHKGWYCNITRPAVFAETVIQSEDLEIDLFVSPDRQTILVLDEDEFAARQFDVHEPAAHAAGLAAVVELRTLAQQGRGPFGLNQATWRPISR